MDKQYQLIRKEVKSLLKERGIYKKATIDELTDACFDDYKMALDSGIAEEDALKQSLLSLKGTLEDYKVNKKKKIPFRYSLVLSISALVITLAIALIARGGGVNIGTFRTIYRILFLLSLIVLVYTICSFKKRDVLDYVVAIALFVASLIILIESFFYFYRSTTDHFFYSLSYEFPGILEFYRHDLVSICPEEYVKQLNAILFDPTLIVSFVCLIVSVIASIVKGVKKKWWEK